MPPGGLPASWSLAAGFRSLRSFAPPGQTPPCDPLLRHRPPRPASGDTLTAPGSSGTCADRDPESDESPEIPECD